MKVRGMEEYWRRKGGKGNVGIGGMEAAGNGAVRREEYR